MANGFVERCRRVILHAVESIEHDEKLQELEVTRQKIKTDVQKMTEAMSQLKSKDALQLLVGNMHRNRR